jgi:hypothetical protein
MLCWLLLLPALLLRPPAVVFGIREVPSPGAEVFIVLPASPAALLAAAPTVDAAFEAA